jgi:hypothetical protein
MNEVLQKFYYIQKRSTAMDNNEQKMMQGADGAYFLSVMRNLKLYENNDEDGALAPVSLISSRSLYFIAIITFFFLPNILKPWQKETESMSCGTNTWRCHGIQLGKDL